MSISAADARPPAPLRVRRPSRLRWMASGLMRWLLMPVLMLGGVVDSIVALSHRNERGFFDYRGGLYDAAVAIRHGVNPYRGAYLAHQAAIMRAGGTAVGETTKHVFSVPLYPAPANLAVVPLSFLPYNLSALVFTALAVASMYLGLRLLGVRDWRCHLLWLISWPFLWGVVLGAIGPFLVLGAAVAWRWRDRLGRPAVAIGAMVAIKIFPWTLAVWLLITRRWRAFALAVVSGLVLCLGGWALIGFHGLAHYAQMLSDATFIQEGRADGITTVLLVLGVSPRVAQAVALLSGVGVLVLAWRAMRLPDGERRAFGLAVIAALISTPIVWDHYMVLLFVPIALMSPRLSRMWFVPVVTQSFVIVSDAVVPSSTHPVAAPPASLHPALGWLAAQAVVGVWLATTPEQRAAWVSLLRGRRRRGVQGSSRARAASVGA